MSGPRQIPMDLPLPPSLSGADFLTSPSNRAAWDAVQAHADWPDLRLALTGPEGCGKSHLVQVWARRTDAAIASAQDLTEPRLAQITAAEAIALEDVDRVAALPGSARRQVETLLFHLYNMASAAQTPLLLTGRRAPAHWEIATPDLASRVQSVLHVRVAEPDDALLSQVLRKRFTDRQMQVGDDVVDYLCLRIERSFAAAEDIVERLDRAALAGRRRITRPLAAEVLGALQG